MNYKNKGSWDARTYDQVSYLVQYRWGQQVLEWRKWRGNEIVMDAGCGSGLLTKQLAKKVPRGKVYAVDIDSNMIKQARNNLQLFDNVEIMQSSFTDIRLPQKLDVVFSNSALHWLQDHRNAFRIFWEMLKPTHSNDNDNDTADTSNSTGNISSSQLLIQCGGYGNLQEIITLLERITYLDQFKAYFTKWKQSWYFAKPDDTNKLLEEIGYVNTRVYSNSDCIILPNRHMYSRFVKTVVAKPYLERLSPDNGDKLKTAFLELFLDEVKKHSNKSKTRWFLDFVRLNIVARRP
ncbi:MAG: class I SAM-dependent methyltransferase [Nitrososphaeraceae archaeon]|jgi:trans-aconitate 2-methyltransferase|nr:class I SAM-dependent methyltransferase [Nitrososphaeraceae archaeon]